MPMARPTFQRKVFLALAAVMLSMLLMFAGLSRLALNQGLGRYVAEIELARLDWLAARLQRAYADAGSWDFLDRDPGNGSEGGENAARGAGNGEAWRRLQSFDDRPPPGSRRPDVAMPPPGGGEGRGEANGAAGAGRETGRDGWRQGARDGTRIGPPEDGGFPPGEGRPVPPEAAGLQHRLALYDATGVRFLAGAAIDPASAVRLFLKVEGNTVGQLLLAPADQGAGGDRLRSEADAAFLARQFWFLLATGLAGLAVALVASWLIGRRWLRPLGDLTAGARRIAGGDLDARIALQGEDELAVLAASLNDMAARLAHIERSRQQWLGDVAHELRTPLAAMRAEIEALQDGVHCFDSDTGARLHRQVMRLGRLVDDLRLSLGQDVLPAEPVPVQPLEVLLDAVEAMRERFARAGLALDAEQVATLRQPDLSQPVVQGDAGRLYQVFANLLENSLRYSDAGGRLRLAVGIDRQRHMLCIDFDDTAPGVPAEQLPRLFERFYSGDASRSRRHGGAGLGLAICRAIVAAHHGRVEAAPSPLGGLRVRVFLPLLT